ncbi:MAG: tRNA preQ1(34) S-adenosylmethionine ribosyltransferase-isomerase QueA [Candidatus Omnitrophica bacterium]|nr:tRNA preQ1(34) S-adenosylmethionine ribosyltransferase-isomerase QueA [Candidatus Omnitrophota bacterium]
MKLEEFNYILPEHLIAQYPLRRRDQARLMVVDRKKGSIIHERFSRIRKYLPQRSCIILNDSKVIPARLLGRRQRGGGRVEVFLLKRLSDGYSYKTLLRPLRRLKDHDRLVFKGGDLIAKVEDWRNRIVRFNKRNISKQLERIGHVPLPPYIKRPDCSFDRKYYQTVYAQKPGSVASPTAGLHFTNRLLKCLQGDGHTLEKVTLHINYATFKPVEERDIAKHKMYFEDYALTKKTWGHIKRAKEEGRKVVAVGTTSCRVLETIAKKEAVGIAALRGGTDIFIYPGFQFRMVDILLTNFHLPLSTLLMLVYAFGSKDLMTSAYREAVKEKYRFFSYGDAMLIL